MRIASGHGLVLAACMALAWWKAAMPMHFALVLAFGLLLHLATTGRMPWLNARPLVFLGAISYPLYLIHQNVGLIALNALGAVTGSAWLRISITIAGCITLAWFISITIERPAMRWIRDKLRPAV